MLLESFQESKIEKGLVISNFYKKVKVEEIYLNKKLRKKVLNVLLNLNECLEGSIPEITQDRKKCTICSWQKYCDKEAKKKWISNRYRWNRVQNGLDTQSKRNN